MLHKRRKKDKCPRKDSYTSTLPSLTFINNLLHSKSTYFYKWWNYTIPSVCILALLVGLYVSVNPNVLYNFSINQVSAWDNITTDPGETGSGDSDTTEPSLSLVINDSPNQVTPAQVGVVAYRTNSFTVTAKDYNYYAVTLSAMRGSGSELRGKNNPFATIDGVGYAVAPDDFKDNTWGYAATTDTTMDPASLVYSTVPAYGDDAYIVLDRPVVNTVSITYKLAFAAKFGVDVPSDNYQGQLILSAVGSAAGTANLNAIKYMQQMTGGICSRTAVGQTKQLEDIRDNKLYWVAKLADGNCWMTQNLDLDLSTSKSLTSADSDVVADWTPSEDTRIGDINSGWSSIYTQVQSWDPGSYYYNYVSATDWASCGGPVANMVGCLDKGNWDTIAPAAQGEHYHVGNYYSWNAATAGTGGLATTGQASSSVCPAGWRLPTGGGTDQELAALIAAYDMNISGGSDSSVNRKIRQAPLYFIPSGFVYDGGLTNAGYGGQYWSATPDTKNTWAYALSFGSGYVAPSYSYNSERNRGFSVRCLADF